MNEIDVKYIRTRIPPELNKTGKCPQCGGNKFYIQHSTFLYFSLESFGRITDINNDHNDWNNVEETKCTACGEVLK